MAVFRNLPENFSNIDVLEVILELFSFIAVTLRPSNQADVYICKLQAFVRCPTTTGCLMFHCFQQARVHSRDASSKAQLVYICRPSFGWFRCRLHPFGWNRDQEGWQRHADPIAEDKPCHIDYVLAVGPLSNFMGWWMLACIFRLIRMEW